MGKMRFRGAFVDETLFRLKGKPVKVNGIDELFA